VSAIPVDEEGNEIPGRSVSNTASILIEAVDPGGIPSFTDGLTASFDLLVNFAAILVLVAGALVPFLPVVLGAWVLWQWLRRRRQVGSPAPKPEPAPGDELAAPAKAEVGTSED
jgi:hypothetical protein